MLLTRSSLTAHKWQLPPGTPAIRALTLPASVLPPRPITSLRAAPDRAVRGARSALCRSGGGGRCGRSPCTAPHRGPPPALRSAAPVLLPFGGGGGGGENPIGAAPAGLVGGGGGRAPPIHPILLATQGGVVPGVPEGESGAPSQCFEGGARPSRLLIFSARHHGRLVITY